MGEESSSCSSETRKRFTWSKETTIELIELYQNHPVLYMVADQNYKNKKIRQAALENIRRELLKFEFCSTQCLNINDIKTKIHTLRTQFFREWGKVKASERGETEGDLVYQPKLWCYDELVFLTESECTTTQNFISLDEQLESQESAVFVQLCDESITEPVRIHKKKSKVSAQREVAEPSSTATTTLQRHNDENCLENDDIHTFAMSLAAEMRKIENPRRLVQLKRDIFNRILDGQDEEIIDDVSDEMYSEK